MFTDLIEKSALVRKASQRFNRRDKNFLSTDSIEKSALVKRNHKDSIEETESEMFINSIKKSALVRRVSQKFNRRDRIRDVY